MPVRQAPPQRREAPLCDDAVVTGTISRRFEALGIEPTEESRRRYRQMLFTTPGLMEYSSSVILFDETLRQGADDGRRLVEILVERGIVPGIKVDKGAMPLAGAPGQRVTDGLDGRRERLDEYRTLGRSLRQGAP